MASFTDTQIPKFNPYIQQLPVEAMVAVGTQKQKAYEEGVQKIQTQIDNIAGLEVGRDADKAYLQSKLNELGNNLRTVAAGDFSNFQLVNSVGGMTKQLATDPYIKAAVTSTAHDKKELALMEEDRKNGKLTPHAELFYGLKRQKYYNSSEFKDENGNPVTFTGRYIQSWDLDKNILEAIKAVGDSVWTEENVYKKVNGQIARDKNGNPILTEYATEAKRAGKFSENVEAAIDGVLARPEAKQELTMRGVYNYRGYDDINDFVKAFEKESKTAIDNLEAKKLKMMENVANATDEKVKAQYQAVINAIDSKIEETKQQTALKTNQALEFGSLEGYKAAYETMKVKNSFMKSGVTEQYTTKYIENIPWNKQRQYIEEERKWNMDLDASRRGWAGVQATRESNALEREKWEYDPKNPKNKLAPVANVLPQGNEYKTFYGEFMDAATSAQENMEASKFNVVTEYMTAINHGNGKTIDKAGIEADIKKYEKANPGFIDRMYGRAKQVTEDPKLSKNPIYSRLISTLPISDLAQAELEKVESTMKNMNNSPEVVAMRKQNNDLRVFEKTFKPFSITYVKDIDKQSAVFGGTRELFGKPKETTQIVTSQDALDMATIAAYRQGLKFFFGSPVEKQVKEAAEKRIQSRFGTSEISSIIGNNPNIKKAMAAAKNIRFSDELKAKETFLQNNYLVAQPLGVSVYGVDMKGPERTSVDDRVKQVLNKYKSVGGLDEFNKLYTDPKKFSAQLVIDRGTPLNPKETWNLKLYDATDVVKSIPISRVDAEYIKQTPITLPPGPSPVAQRIESGKGTTNGSSLSPSNPNAYKAAYVPKSFYDKVLNSTNSKILGADVIQSPTGGYNAFIYTKDPRTGTVIGVPVKDNSSSLYPASFDSADAAASFLYNGINSEAFVNSLIKNGL